MYRAGQSPRLLERYPTIWLLVGALFLAAILMHVIAREDVPSRFEVVCRDIVSQEVIACPK
jgi:hypothetical protein